MRPLPRTGFLFLALFLTQCAGTPPVKSYNIADLALRKAVEAQSEKYAPKNLQIAKKYYNLGKRYYNERKFEKAKKNFLKAIDWAEKAENLSFFKQVKQGEIASEE